MGIASVVLSAISIGLALFMPISATALSYICGLTAIVLGTLDFMPILKAMEKKGVGEYIKCIVQTALGKENKEKRFAAIGIILGVLSFPMDSSLFETWFELHLLPRRPANTVIVMDNASFHRKSKLYHIAERARMRLIFLPPYSPELNPIERFWSWLKRQLLKTLHSFPTLDDAFCSAFHGR